MEKKFTKIKIIAIRIYLQKKAKERPEETL